VKNKMEIKQILVTAVIAIVAVAVFGYVKGAFLSKPATTS